MEQAEIIAQIKVVSYNSRILREEDADKIVVLEGGKLLYNWYGKYRPNLCLVFRRIADLCLQPADYRQFNLEPDGHLRQLIGRFWVSKKGTNCFEPNPDGPHILLACSWGGAFDRTRGQLAISNPLFCRHASSNGGGVGTSYWVVPRDFRRTLSEDDI